MADLATSAMMASIVVGMLTIPAASQTIDSSQAVSGDMPNISSSSDYVPKEESTETTADSFTREVSTAFQEFETRITSSEAETSLESSRARFEVTRESGEKKWILETSDGKLTVVETPSGVEETVETPHGALEIEKSGGVSQSFEGSSREKVEEARSELKQLMKEKREEVKQMNEKTRRKRYSKALSLEVNPEGDDEHISIKNSMATPIDATGWNISNSDPDSLILDNAVVPGNSELRVYTDERDDLNVTEEEGVNYVYDSNVDWDLEDTAALKLEGEKLAEKSYDKS